MVKPLAPVGKQVRCAVAPKTFVSLEHITNTLRCPDAIDKELYELGVARLHTVEIVPCLNEHLMK